LASIGPKSIIAPNPINSRHGKSSVKTPDLYRILIIPPWSEAAKPANGRFSQHNSKTMGSAKIGSIFLAVPR